MGELPGYGIPHGERTSWYVYEDTLPMPAAARSAEVAAERDHYRTQAAASQEVVLRVLAANEKRREAESFRDEAIKLMGQALDAATTAGRLSRDADADTEEALRQIVLPDTIAELEPIATTTDGPEPTPADQP